jgi:hypothetical protein
VSSSFDVDGTCSRGALSCGLLGACNTHTNKKKKRKR